MISLIMILRLYLGLSQSQLAQQLGVSLPLIVRLEKGKAQGTLEPYLRLSALWQIPVDAFLANDFTLIPATFFSQHAVLPEKHGTDFSTHEIGFRGEQLVLQQERDRVGHEYPQLLPLVRRTEDFIRLKGYDILSFDEQGNAIAIEVKSSISAQGGFKFSDREKVTAEEITADGGQYLIVLVHNLDDSYPHIQRSIRLLFWTSLTPPKIFERRLNPIMRNDTGRGNRPQCGV